MNIRNAGTDDIDFILDVVEKLDDIISDDGIYQITKENIALFLESPYVKIIIPYENEDMGFFLFVQQNKVTVELHTCILPGFAGKLVTEASALVKEVIKQQYSKIITLIPVFNKPAMFMALRCGFTKEGVNKRSFLKDGIIYDQYYMGLILE
jgi:hypothetical protein